MRGVVQFNCRRLNLALDLRGMTQTSLCELINYSSGTVSKWCSGQQYPESSALQKISQALNIPESWFLKSSPYYDDTIGFFRSNSSTTQLYRKKAMSFLKIAYELNLVIEDFIDYPDVIYPRILDRDEALTLDDKEIESLALLYRKYWNLGSGPITNIIKVLENAGTIIVKKQLDSTQMDGVSKWFFQRPYIFIATDKSNSCRNRFDIAHELAHLIMHRHLSAKDYQTNYKRIEEEANYFASCFLCPAEGITFDLYSPTLDSLVIAKKKWKVSVAALIMRAKSLGLLNDTYYERLWRNYSYRKWRIDEPLDELIEQEDPSLLRKSIKLLVDEEILTKDSLKHLLTLYDDDIETICHLPKKYLTPEFGTVITLKRFNRPQQKDIVYLDDESKIIKMPAKV